MKVAIIHFVLLYMSGAERVLEALSELYPDADIFTHAYDPTKISDQINQHSIRTTFINDLPRAKHWYQSYLPLMPYALEQLDLSGYDLIISSESGPTKGIVPDPDSLHVCYCHSPMRYVWDMYHEYTKDKNPISRLLLAPMIHKLKIWDHASASRVDHFVANSSFVSRRIQKYFRRESTVISPPVRTDEFHINADIGDFYLWLGRFVGYKNPGQAVRAFNKSGKRLVMIGAGEELEACRAIAKSNIDIMGYQSFDVIQDHLARCRAMIFPGVEDAGITPVEAMASGRPVIAYNKGGVQDTVIHSKTGILYADQSADGLIEAVAEFEKQGELLNPDAIRKHAQTFDKEIFKQKFQELVTQEMSSFKN